MKSPLDSGSSNQGFGIYEHNQSRLKENYEVLGNNNRIFQVPKYQYK